MSILSWLFGRGQRREPRFTPLPQSALERAIERDRARKRQMSFHPLPGGAFRFVALDVETANSDVGSICQIGLAFVRDDEISSTWSTLIDPQDEFDPSNIHIHGITPDHVAGAPVFRDVLPYLTGLLTKNTIFQHSSFDRRAIEAACHRSGLSIPTISWSDSVRVAQSAWPELRGNKGHGLASLKKHLKLEFEHHDAEEDARACAEVVIRAEQATGQPFSELLIAPSSKKSYQFSAEGRPDGALVGEVATFTGSLTITREQATALASAQGITVTAGVTKRTTLLIVGDQDLAALAGHSKSSKHRKAEELIASGQPIRIIGQSEFMKLVSFDAPPRATPKFNIRKHLHDNEKWVTATEVILASAGPTPQEIFDAVRDISEVFSEVITKFDLSPKNAVDISMQIDEMVDVISDLALDAELDNDPRQKEFEVALKAIEALEEAAGKLVDHAYDAQRKSFARSPDERDRSP